MKTESNFSLNQVSNNESNYMVDTRIVIDLFSILHYDNVSITKPEA